MFYLVEQGRQVVCDGCAVGEEGVAVVADETWRQREDREKEKEEHSGSREQQY